MKILVIGSGGREHALCWRLRKSSKVTELYCAPGNPGIREYAEYVPIETSNVQALADFAERTAIDLTVVGPELPLSLGIVNLFHSRGLTIFGPTRECALLEASKSFAKKIMVDAGVPTAMSKTLHSRKELEEYCEVVGPPLVIKADGLAAGKGVFVCTTAGELREAINSLYLDFNPEIILVEEYLKGIEASFIVAAHDGVVVPFATSHDYKRALDGNRGYNTGGMGSVSPTPFLCPDQESSVIERIIVPVLKAMGARGTPFTGFLYAGLMISPTGEIHVLEFNTRLGDPECQVLMRRFQSDLPTMLLELLEGKRPTIQWSEERALCVVLAAEGYPMKSIVGEKIEGIEEANSMPGVVVYHAGTATNRASEVVTAGGRVLGITATGRSLEEARERAYEAVEVVRFKGEQFRRDIGGPNA